MITLVPTGVVSRSVEDQAVADFLTLEPVRPSGLVIEGEAGIGKTTLWLAAVEQARQRGFRVLSARVGQAESALAYAALADLLADVGSGGHGRACPTCNALRWTGCCCGQAAMARLPINE